MFCLLFEGLYIVSRGDGSFIWRLIWFSQFISIILQGEILLLFLFIYYYFFHSRRDFIVIFIYLFFVSIIQLSMFIFYDSRRDFIVIFILLFCFYHSISSEVYKGDIFSANYFKGEKILWLWIFCFVFYSFINLFSPFKPQWSLERRFFSTNKLVKGEKISWL